MRKSFFTCKLMVHTCIISVHSPLLSALQSLHRMRQSFLYSFQQKYIVASRSENEQSTDGLRCCYPSVLGTICLSTQYVGCSFLLPFFLSWFLFCSPFHHFNNVSVIPMHSQNHSSFGEKKKLVATIPSILC